MMANSPRPPTPATSKVRPERRNRSQSKEPRLTRIARRAHQLYEARGRNDGRDFDDWLQAEREIDEESEKDERS